MALIDTSKFFDRTEYIRFFISVRPIDELRERTTKWSSDRSIGIADRTCWKANPPFLLFVEEYGVSVFHYAPADTAICGLRLVAGGVENFHNRFLNVAHVL